MVHGMASSAEGAAHALHLPFSPCWPADVGLSWARQSVCGGHAAVLPGRAASGQYLRLGLWAGSLDACCLNGPRSVKWQDRLGLHHFRPATAAVRHGVIPARSCRSGRISQWLAWLMAYELPARMLPIEAGSAWCCTGMRSRSPWHCERAGQDADGSLVFPMDRVGEVALGLGWVVWDCGDRI